MNRAIKLPLMLAATAAVGASAVSPASGANAADPSHSRRPCDRSGERGGRGLRQGRLHRDCGRRRCRRRHDRGGARRRRRIHTLDSAHDKAYTSVTFKNDTTVLADRAKGDGPIAALAKLPHILFFPGGVVIKLNDEVIGGIGAAGAPGGNLDDNCAKAGLEKIRDRLK